MESMITVSYLLDKDPVRFTFLNQDKTSLSLSTSYRFSNMQPDENGVKIDTSGGELTLLQEGRKFQFRWAGESVKNQIRLDGMWFGIGELIHQAWDLSKITLPLSDFLTSDSGATGYSNLMTPAFISQSGALLVVKSAVKVGINQLPNTAEIDSEYVFGEEVPFEQRPAFDRHGRGDGFLTLVGDDLAFDLIIEANALEAHQALVREVGHPTKTPPLSLFGAPVWTTWAQYKDEIDQATVLDFAHQIVESGYPFQVLEIDDRWQTQYGELAFDPVRFPDAKAMIEELHQLGFKVTTWIVPFLHPNSSTGQEAAEKGFVVRQPDGAPYLVRWWQGKAYLLDVTNPQAMSWFGVQLRLFQAQTGVDGFKFDGGEATFVPQDAVLHQSGDSRNHYSQAYTNWVAHNFSLCEVRTGWFNQKAPLLFRVWDLWSSWGRDNGLRSIIPATLQLSLTGYPFSFPDMIGGNGYFTFPKNKLLLGLINKVIIPMMERRKQEALGDDGVGIHASDAPAFTQQNPMFGWPTAELMIRWTQLNALMPVMQFSIVPWQFGDECAAICKQYAELHLEFTPLFEELANKAARNGEALIRPVFFLAPEDPQALACDDQFLVGDRLMVAPVLEKGKRSRDIYLPPGTWRDHWTGAHFPGSQVLKDYAAPLDVLPLFYRMGKDELL
ncbi:glycoside hydrolase family 31 protein [bacterium]|nr:glycoside hydrolase family 31 protein [bacterium]